MTLLLPCILITAVRLHAAGPEILVYWVLSGEKVSCLTAVELSIQRVGTICKARDLCLHMILQVFTRVHTCSAAQREEVWNRTPLQQAREQTYISAVLSGGAGHLVL